MNYIYSGQHSMSAYPLLQRVSLLSLVLFLASCWSSLYATNYTVTDASNANTGSGTMGTLRYCITQANLSAGPHTINFAVPSVTFASDYPIITKPVTIDGGPSKVIVQCTAGDGNVRPFYLTTGASGSTLKNLDIRGGGYEPIRIDGALSNITIEDMVCSNSAGDFWNYGVFVTGNATNYTIRNFVMNNLQNGLYGIYFGGTTSNVTIDNVKMYDGPGTSGIGMRFVGAASNISITNSLIDLDAQETTNEGDYGILFDNNVNGLTMTNDTINYSDLYGVLISGTLTNGNIQYLKIKQGGAGTGRGFQVSGVVSGLSMDNVLIDMDTDITTTPGGDDADYGIVFGSNVSDLNINNLTMHDAEIHHLYIAGNLTGTNTISNSTFDNFDGYGGYEMIRFNGTVSGLTMTNVTIDGDQTGTTDDSNNGIGFIGTVSNTTLTNVSVNEADDNGIYVWTAATNLAINGGKLTNNYDGFEIYNCYNRVNVDLTNIKIDNSTRYGIVIPACFGGLNDDIDMTGDTITNSGQDGIYIHNANIATDITISGCVISGNGRTTAAGDGIQITAPDNVVITQNSIFNNAGLGINLTGNGNCNLENTLAPIINSVTPLGGGQYQISFTIPAAAGAGTYKAEFFTNNPIAGPEGEYYVHTVTGLSTGTHVTTFTSTTGPAANPMEASVTMTYTRSGAACNGTSEFSNSMALNPQGPACVNTGILGWYRPDKLTGYTNGQAVEQLLDFSGNTNKFRQYVVAEQPKYFSGDASTNFNPSITYDGAGDNFEITKGLLPINTGGSIFAAAYHINTAATWGDLYNQNIDDPVLHKTAGIQDIGLLDNGNVFYNEPTMKWVNNITAIGGMDYGTVANSTHLFFNGRSSANLGGTASPEAGIGYIGGENTGESWVGKIHEMIFYNRPLNATERQKVNSYLSIKWGTSIDTIIMKVAGAGNNYITSDGTVIWTANNTYYHRITGIGRDDCTGLLQKQSRNVNLSSPGYPTIGLGTIAANNPSNANTFAADKSFMVWADDGKVGTGTTTITGDGVITLTGGACAQYGRLAKTFKVQETGTVGNVQLEFNMSGVKLGKTLADYYLAINSTSTFSGTITKLVAPSSYNHVTGVLVFNNVDFTDGQFFTVIGKRVYGPANITANLALWLKAEDGIAGNNGDPIDIWADQGPTGNDALQSTATKRPLYQTTTNLINFNPAVDFDGADDDFTLTSSILKASTSYNSLNVFAVSLDKVISQSGYFLWQTTASGRFGAIPRWNNGYSYIETPGINQFYGNSSPLTVNIPDIWQFTNEPGATGTTIKRSNINLTLNSTVGTSNTGANNPFYIGSRNSNFWNGRVGEIILFTGALLPVEKQKIASYLAVKWGISLDQTTAYDYLGSDGTVIWNATTNATYKNRITGIGRDDCSDLNQKQSRNQDTTTAYVTMSLGTLKTSNPSNTNTFAADKSFLLWGDDNATGISSAAITGDGTITLNPGACGVFKRLAKTFKVQETGTIGDVQVQVALRGATLGKVASDFYLAIHSSATFTGVITKLVAASSYSNGVLTFDNVDFASGQYFTIIGQRSEGPANLTSHLKLWLRADDGLTLNGNAVSAWADQGPAGSNVAQASPANQPIYNSSSNLINFNPSLSFDGSNDYLRPVSSIFGTGNLNYTTFGIANSAINSGYRFWLADGNDGCNTSVGFGHASLTLTNDNWCNSHNSGIISLNQTYLEGFSRNAMGTLRTNYINGFATPTNNVAGLNKVNGATTIGASFAPNYFWNGLIGEIIAYDTILSLANQQKINSYLAVKWGLTLDQSSPYNYVAANGTVVWDATVYAPYKNRITGIARDDCSNLLQKQSRNQDAGSLVTLSNGSSISTTNDANANNFSADNSWLLVGDNNKGLTWTGSGVPINGGNVRLNRVWRVEETGTVGTIYLEVPDNTSALPTKLPATTFSIYLLVANSGTNGRFNALSGVTVQQMTFDATNKKWYTTYNFADGDYFTFGSEKTCIAPVGISEGLTAWYHATNMPTGAIAVNTANAISDQAFGVYPLNRNGVGTATVLAGSATSFNYNRSISLTGNAAFTKGSLTNADVLSAPAGSMFAVGTSNTNLFNLSSNSSNVSGIGANAQFNGAASTYASGIFGTPNVYSMLGSTAGVTGYTNGTAGTTSGSIGGRGVATYTLGLGQNGSNVNYNNSNIAEAFTFDRVLDAFEKDILESYLAIKYGQTLSHNYYNADYDGTNAATTTIYDISTYSNRVFGIGNDTTGCFHQKQSTSALPGSMLRLGIDTIAAENNSNTAVFLQDRAYVMAGDNNALANAWLTGGGGNPALPTIYASTCELPTRIARQWKVTATYNNPALVFAIPDATSSELSKLPTVPAGYSVWMVINENTDFGVNALQEEVAMTLNPTTKNWETTYQIEAGKTKYLTFVLKNDLIATGATQPTIVIATLDNSCTPDDGKVLSGATTTLIASGAATYSWNNMTMNDTLIVNPLATTTYTVTATAANGCKDTVSTSITIVTAPVGALVETDNSCTPNDGKILNAASATLTVSGGGTYLWDNASTAAVRVVTPFSTTTYTVTITDANGCTDTLSSTVTIISSPLVSIVETDNSCTANDGNVLSAAAATLTASGGGTYLWENSSTAAVRIVNPTATTTYSVTITDVNGCVATVSNAVTVVSAPVASITETDNSCTVNDNKVLSGAAATLTASGGGTYTWDDASTAAIRMVNPTMTSTYTVTVTDANGCTATANRNITIVTVPTASIVETDNSCTPNDGKVLSGATTTLTASGGGTYSWDDASILAVRIVYPATNTTYSVTVTDANGCTATASNSVTVVTGPTASISETDNSCTPNDGKVLSAASATLTASGGGTYLWDNSSTAALRMVSPGSTTTYMVTVTDANGCTATASNTVTVVSAPIAAIVETDNSCTPNDGKVLTGAAATLTASGGGTYLWDNASTVAIRNVNPVVTTNYAVTVTDANGCTATASNTITIVTSPTATISASDNSCTPNDSKVLSGAAVTLTASGGGTYLWDNASVAAIRVLNPTSTSTYFVTVTDANGCTVVEGKTITVVSMPTVAINETDNSCNSNDSKVLSGGTATLMATGGTIYLWDDASSAPSRNVSPTMTTTYTVTVTDVNGCMATGSATVTVVSAPTGSISSADNSCFDNDEIIAVGGAATLTASGGLTFLWDNASTAAVRVVSPVVTTTFTVTVTDANGCTASANKKITVIAFCGVTVAAKVFLGAVYDDGTMLMSDNLRAANLLPLNQPYGGMEYPDFAYTGTEATTAPVLSITGSNAIVDWVLVEIRDSVNPVTILSRKAALVQRDGDIVDVDGVSPLLFTGTDAGNYYVAIRHRNHLGVMTGTAVALSPMASIVDFTLSATSNYQLSGVTGSPHAQRTWGSTKRSLWAGNAGVVSNTEDKVIFQGSNSDVDEMYFKVLLDLGNTMFLPNYIVPNIYARTDTNLDGMVVYQGSGSDPDVSFFAVLQYPLNALFLPNYTLFEQIPK